jgi:hypothetical protein
VSVWTSHEQNTHKSLCEARCHIADVARILCLLHGACNRNLHGVVIERRETTKLEKKGKNGEEKRVQLFF